VKQSASSLCGARQGTACRSTHAGGAIHSILEKLVELPAAPAQRPQLSQGRGRLLSISPRTG
jgi:hypothetical protein